MDRDGAKDAALIIAIEDYAKVDRVVGANADADDWLAYFLSTRRIPAQNIVQLRDGDASSPSPPPREVPNHLRLSYPSPMAPNQHRAQTHSSVRFDVQAHLAGLALDARGLLPLAAARAIVARATQFLRDGDPTSDLLWAALLSLEDGAELAREGARLEWAFPHLRGWDNEDAVLRYGADALPWLVAMLDAYGTCLPTGPGAPFYFVGTNLLAIGPEAAGAVVRVEHQGDSDPDRLGYVKLWLARHGAPAWQALAVVAANGDPAAERALAAFARRSPSQVRRLLGPDLAARALAGAPKKLTAESVLAVLDAAAAAPIGARLPWPTIVASAGHFEYHAMRVVAVRSTRGDDWGILVEVVQGDILGAEDDVRWPATIQRYTYGSKVPSGGAYLVDARPIPAVVHAQALDEARVRALDLRPGRSITGAIADWPSVLALRALVASDPDALFPPAGTQLGALGLPRAEVLLDVRALEHVGGTAHGAGALARLPSSSPSWRSIAEVIATRDPERFEVGASNVDWRRYATQETAVPDT